MTAARRPLNLFVTFSRQPTLKFIIIVKITKYGLLFCVFNVTRTIKNFVQMSILLNKTKIAEILTKLKAQKKANHILEIPGLGVLSDY